MTIDLLCLTLIIIFSIVGYIRGLLNQVLSILTLVLILLFAKPLADWLKYDSNWSWFSKSPELVLWLTCALFFLLFTWGLERLIKFTSKDAPLLTPINRWTGLSFGAIKGFIITLIIGTIYLTLPEDFRGQFADLDRDARKSIFMSMSRGVSSWQGVSSIHALQEIQHRLEPEELKFDLVDRLNEVAD